MKIRTVALAAGALSLMASPAIADTAFDRASAPLNGESELDGEGGSTILFALLGAAAVVGGIIVASGNDDDTPTSP